MHSHYRRPKGDAAYECIVRHQSLIFALRDDTERLLFVGDSPLAMSAPPSLVLPMRELRARILENGPYTVVIGANHSDWSAIQTELRDDSMFLTNHRRMKLTLGRSCVNLKSTQKAVETSEKREAPYRIDIPGASDELSYRDLNFGSVSAEEIADMSYILFQKYERNLPQKSIAKALRTSQSHVSALLSKAERMGMVKFLLHLPRKNLLEARLMALFHSSLERPKAVVVSIRRELEASNLSQAVGICAARYFESIVDGCESIALDGGETISYMIEALNRRLENISLYPVAGGPLDNPYTSVPALIGRFLGKFGRGACLRAEYLPLPNTDFKTTPARWRETIRKSEAADILLLGVGSATEHCLTSTVQTLFEELQINKRTFPFDRSIGIAAYSVFDKNGDAVPSSFDEKVCKLSWGAIQGAARSRRQHVILMGGGSEKVRPILSLIKGGCCNVVVTDETTAESVLSLARQDG